MMSDHQKKTVFFTVIYPPTFFTVMFSWGKDVKRMVNAELRMRKKASVCTAWLASTAEGEKYTRL